MDSLNANNREQTLLLIGAGGLGQSIAEMVQMSGRFTKIAFLDDDPSDEKSKGYHIIGRMDEAAKFAVLFEFALPTIGNNALRLGMMEQLISLGYAIPKIIHPAATVSPSAVIDDGCIIMAQAVISHRVQIKKASLINIGAMIDHGCVIGEGAHIPMGCVVRNEVVIPALAAFRPLQVIE